LQSFSEPVKVVQESVFVGFNQKKSDDLKTGYSSPFADQIVPTKPRLSSLFFFIKLP
jgi:hypothetical protein